MKVLNNNFADLATLTSADAISSGQLDWLKNDNIGQRVAFTAATASIVIDLGSAQAPTAFAVVDHNMGATGDQWRVEGNNTDAWTTPGYQSAWVRAWSGRIGIYYPSPVAYRFWRITMQASASITLGRVFSGSFVASPRAVANDFVWRPRPRNTRVTTPGGQVRYGSGSSTKETTVQIKGADAIQMQAFADAIPVGVTIVDLLPLHPTRSLDNRAYGDIHNIQINETNTYTSTAEMVIENQMPPVAISNGPASDSATPVVYNINWSRTDIAFNHSA